MGTEALGNIVLLAFKRVIAVHIQFHYKPNPMLVNLVGIYSTLGGQKFSQSPIHWSMFRPNPALRLLYSRLQYCNLTDFMRGMILINQLIYVVIRPNSEAPYVRP